ncbi:ABC transporter permease [Arenibaculum pallidiluteum]|uniref:ABC transporter permease n=1 Tax=Arenibaculum pallidiluteum TaxID=2812559 RepID=UPI001A9660E3|nr:ABC transporter permease subunit [Arenibaculum pallidiluteum]
MAETSAGGTVAWRPEREYRPAPPGAIGDVSQSLPWLHRLAAREDFWRLAVLVALALVWEGYGRWLDDDLLFPTFSQTVAALWTATVSGVLPLRTLASLETLAMGYAGGVALAAILTTFATSTRIGAALLTTLTAMFNPLPAIALLPLALLWFGLGTPSLVFVITHSVLWAVALNAHAGFRSVGPTLRKAGHTFGLTGWRYVAGILVPAAFPSILSGLKMGWAFAWRTLIAAELVFGASSSGGGLGWFIFEHRNQLLIAEVFAGLLTVIAIGLVVESLVFGTIERRTLDRWGMRR